MAGVPWHTGIHRDRLLEDDADAAVRGVFERSLSLSLFVLLAETILPETVKRGTQSGIR